MLHTLSNAEIIIQGREPLCSTIWLTSWDFSSFVLQKVQPFILTTREKQAEFFKNDGSSQSKIAYSKKMVYMDKWDDWIFTKNHEVIYHKRRKK